MSVFRASKVVEPEFVELVESDYLEHWLWGRFRFLSGDDKSTWYALLNQGAEMLYVPDALVWTIEVVGDDPIRRATQNILRWSGNMLRNGTRAIALGPWRVGFFIWWCLIDQRLAIWTSLCGFIAFIGGGLLISPIFFPSFVIWIFFTRFILTLFLARFLRKIDLSVPLVLYANQMISAVFKVYILFRLPYQRWFHRQDQVLSYTSSMMWKLKEAFAGYLTTLYLCTLVFFVLVYIKAIDLPPLMQIRLIVGY
jgi:glycosyltransferase Alg8